MKSESDVYMADTLKTFDDVYADPTNIVLKIFDPNYTQIGENINITLTDTKGTGIYECLYTIPITYNHSSIIAEFSGILESKKVLNRISIPIEG